MTDMSSMEPSILVELKHKALPFKKIIGVMKDMLSEVNLQFGNSLVIEGVDPEQISAMRVHVTSLNEYYSVDGNTRIGIYLGYFHKLLRGVTAKHDLTLTIHRETPQILEVMVSHPETNVQSFTSIKSINVPMFFISIPETSLSVAVVPAKELQKAVREMGLLSKRLSLGYTDDKLSLVASGNVGVGHVSISPSEKGLQWIKRDSEPLHRFYFSKYLEKIIRPDISELVDLNFGIDQPLVIQYSDRDYLAVFEFALADIKEGMAIK